MTECALSLGSNLGNRLANIRAAVELLEKSACVTAKSEIYETPPWGVTSQPRFLNCCVMIETDKTPLELLTRIKSIEREIGRITRGKWETREIDIDILTYGSEIIVSPELTIPHPLMYERAFVLVPLLDVAPRLIHHENGEKQELIAKRAGSEGIVRVTSL